MVENFLITGRERLASPLAIAELRGDNQMEWAVTPGELRPVTIDDVISPVPMNPSCMSFSCRFRICQHSIRRRGRADTWRVVGYSEVIVGRGGKVLVGWRTL